MDNFDESADFYYQRLIAAINEDIPALENQQLGLNSPLAKQGRYHELLEPNVAHFDFWYASSNEKRLKSRGVSSCKFLILIFKIIESCVFH